MELSNLESKLLTKDSVIIRFNSIEELRLGESQLKRFLFKGIPIKACMLNAGLKCHNGIPYETIDFNSTERVLSRIDLIKAKEFDIFKKIGAANSLISPDLLPRPNQYSEMSFMEFDFEQTEYSGDIVEVSQEEKMDLAVKLMNQVSRDALDEVEDVIPASDTEDYYV